MTDEILQRLKWIKLYQERQNSGQKDYIELKAGIDLVLVL
jgi:hypothetical protein